MWPEINYFIYLSLLTSVLILVLPKAARHQKQNISIATNIVFIILTSGLIGARLFHVLYEDGPAYKQNPFRFFYLWNGGFVYYGGAFTAAFATYLYLSFKKINVGRWFDFLTPFLSISYGLGRGACFIVGCCYGKLCNAPWAVNNRHPTQLYAALWELVVFFIIFFRWKYFFLKNKPGQLFWLWILGHALGRLVMENYRDDFRGAIINGVSISSWISLLLLVVSIFKLNSLNNNFTTKVQ